jgi:heme A synthase
MSNLLYLLLELLFFVTRMKPPEKVEAKSNAPLAVVVVLVLIAVGVTIYVYNPKFPAVETVASFQV